MPITFDGNWNGVGAEGYLNHASDRSESEVERLVHQVAEKCPDSAVATALGMNWDVRVEKGIHQRTEDGKAHIRIWTSVGRYHINLRRSNYRTLMGSRTFVWEVESVS